ncbi:MAG: hypothetical protein AB2L14_29145 [Candidatus Xenobiia bacterium LiM19]
MSDIHIQPATAFTSANGGTGYYAGIKGMNTDGTKAGGLGGVSYAGPNGGQAAAAGGGAIGPNGAAAGGQAWVVGPDGGLYAAKGGVVSNAAGTAGAGAVGVDNAKGSLYAQGAFGYNKATGELDAGGAAQWTNKSTGESHNAQAYADLQKGQGGTITTVKDGVQKTHTVPPRPTV